MAKEEQPFNKVYMVLFFGYGFGFFYTRFICTGLTASQKKMQTGNV